VLLGTAAEPAVCPLNYHLACIFVKAKRVAERRKTTLTPLSIWHYTLGDLDGGCFMKLLGFVVVFVGFLFSVFLALPAYPHGVGLAATITGKPAAITATADNSPANRSAPKMRC
jgi:hypothetical protein